MAERQTFANKFGCAKWIVDATAAVGTHTTIATALTSASSGDTIFIRPGTYTENLTLKAGVNLTAFGSDSSLNGTGKVIISGTCTLTTAGSVTISGIQLQTNSAALLAVTGTLASIVNLQSCYLNCTNNSGITFSTSSASGAINIQNCDGDLGTTGINIFAHSSAGVLTLTQCYFTNSGASTTVSTASAGSLVILNSFISSPITTSSTNSATIFNSTVRCGQLNATAYTGSGSGVSTLQLSTFAGGTASAISASTNTTNVHNCVADSTNTNAVTGAGTIVYAEIAMSNTSSLINTTSQTRRNINTGGVSFDGGTNTLSTYTEGTFVPTVIGAATAGATTYTAQNGYYIRVGNLVTIQGTINISAATGTGAWSLESFPFTVRSQTNGNALGTLGITGTGAWPASRTMLAISATSNATTGIAIGYGTGVASSNVQVTNTATNFFYNVTYEI